MDRRHVSVGQQMQDVLDELERLTVAPVEELPPTLARRGARPVDAVRALMLKRGIDPTPQAVDRVENRTVPGAGGPIEIRLYGPKTDAALPVILYWHGGGFVLADLDSYDATPRALTEHTGCLVVSAHYRQGPEHRFPAAVEDAFTAYTWVCAHAHELGGDASRIAVAGESAGGNLATVVCLLARRLGIPTLPRFQLLVYPVTRHGFDTDSMREFERARPLNTRMMRWFWEHYLEDDADGSDPRASPINATDLATAPPAFIVLAEVDPLRSEGEQYGEMLRAAGVEVEVKCYPGTAHEFFGMGAVVEAARDAMAEAAEQLRTRLDVEAPRSPIVEPGVDVFTRDGERLGTVKHRRLGDFLVDRSRRRDLFIPYSAVAASAATGVTLRFSSDEVGDLDWPKPLPVKLPPPVKA